MTGDGARPRATLAPTPALFAWGALLVVAANSLCRVASAVPTNADIYRLREEWDWCGPRHEVHGLVGLDDYLCQKVFPGTFDRDFQCPRFSTSGQRPFATPGTNVSETAIDEAELDNIVNGLDFSVAVGIVKRNGDGTYGIRYLGKNAREPHETWSSSKVYAGHHAANKLRGGGIRFPGLSTFEVGKAAGNSNALPPAIGLSDLMTIVASYDTTKNLSSNQLGAYYHSIGGHEDANRFLHEVLGAPGTESFGGDYGEAVPSPPLSYHFTTSRTSFGRNVTIPADHAPKPPLSNTMSAITMAEWLRRLVFAREDNGIANHSFFQWQDSQDIFYGSDNSSLFPTLQYGGMSMSSDVYVQLGLGMENLNRTTVADWRIFSKLGFGYTSIRKQYEVTLNAYLCLPLGENGRGIEFVLSAKTFDKTLDDGEMVDLKMREGIRNITQYLLQHYT